MREDEFFREAHDQSVGPLAGIRVIGLTKVWSGPLATCVLGDLGAEVINIEHPRSRDGEVPPNLPGTGLSWFRQSVHRNKRSISIDLRDDAGRGLLLRLVATADIIVENFRPGTLDSWGMGYDACREIRDDIIFVSISGWGQYGPNAHLPAYDPIIQAASGWMWLNRTADGVPARAPTFLADEMAGLHAAIGALAALAHRDRSGEGQHVDVSMMDAMFSASSGLHALAAAGAPISRMGNETEFVAPSNVYQCSDGYLYLAVALDKHWRALAELIGASDLARADGYRSNEERLKNRDAINKLICDWCRDRSVATAVNEMESVGLVVGPVRTMSEAVADQHVVARGLLPTVLLSNGTLAPLVAPPVKFSRTPTRIRRSAPSPGSDTEEILAALEQAEATRKMNADFEGV